MSSQSLSQRRTWHGTVVKIEKDEQAYDWQDFFNKNPVRLLAMLRVLRKWREKKILKDKEEDLGFPRGFSKMPSVKRTAIVIDWSVDELTSCRKACLNVDSYRTKRDEIAFGEFIRSHGGLKGILTKHIVELSESFAMMSFASAYASRNNVTVNLENRLSEESSKLIVRFAYENKYLLHKTDPRVTRFISRCRHSKKIQSELIEALKKKKWWFDSKSHCPDGDYDFLKQLCYNHLEDGKSDPTYRGILLEIYGENGNKEVFKVDNWRQAEQKSDVEKTKFSGNTQHSDSEDSEASEDSDDSVLIKSSDCSMSVESDAESTVENIAKSSPKKRLLDGTDKDDLPNKKPRITEITPEVAAFILELSQTLPGNPLLSSQKENVTTVIEEKSDNAKSVESQAATSKSSETKENTSLSVEVEKIPPPPPNVTSLCSIEKTLIHKTIHEFIGKFWESKKYSDVVFTIKNEKINGHKVILSGVSEEFTKIFDSSETGKEISITDVQPQIFNELLRFIYTREIERTSDSKVLIELRQAVDKYLNYNLVNEFVIEWEGHLIDVLKTENAAEILMFTDRMKMESLKKYCMKFVWKNFEEIAVTAGYRELLRLNPELLTELFISAKQ